MPLKVSPAPVVSPLELWCQDTVLTVTWPSSTQKPQHHLVMTIIKRVVWFCSNKRHICFHIDCCFFLMSHHPGGIPLHSAWYSPSAVSTASGWVPGFPSNLLCFALLPNFAVSRGSQLRNLLDELSETFHVFGQCSKMSAELTFWLAFPVNMMALSSVVWYQQFIPVTAVLASNSVHLSRSPRS